MPPKKNKKPSKNGFWQFALEIRDKSTNRSMSAQELQEYAARKWANMSKEERKPYEERAQLLRNDYKPTRLTTDGYEIDLIERQNKEAEEQERRMKNTILSDLRSCAVAGTLGDQIFLIVHINHLIYYPAEDKYFICEIAMVAFSLQNGIEDMFHKIVQPGKLPLGFYGGALTHSKETHQLIDTVQNEPYDNNTYEVFSEMIHFMRRFSSDKKKLPVVYADDKTLEMTKKVFHNFRCEFNFPEEIKVYNMQYMFFALKNAASGRDVWPTETFSYNTIEKDLYCYTPYISCEFHELGDNSVYCSKSIVTRYVYTICDNCCPDLSIQLIPGFHIPQRAKLHGDTSGGTRFSSQASSMNNLNELSGSNRGSRRESVGSSQGYEENYPPLGGNRSAAKSLLISRIFFSFAATNNLSSYLVHTKDNGPPNSKSGVYQMNCSNCNVVYVGQTGRKIAERAIAPSVVSFSSMKTPGQQGPTSSAGSLENSVQRMSIDPNPPKRFTASRKFPPRRQE